MYVIFSDNKTQSLKDGDLRIKVNISGDKVTSFNRYVHLPEEWEREEKNNRTTLGLFRTVSYFTLVFFIIYAAAASIAGWSKGSFNLNIFKLSFIILAVMSVVGLINGYPNTVSDFSSAKPYLNQLISDVGISLIFGLIMAFLWSAILGNISSSFDRPIHEFSILEVVLISVGLIGFAQIATNLSGQLTPLWIEGGNVTNTYLPLFNHVIRNIMELFNNSIILLFIITLINKLTNFGKKRKYLYYLISALFMMCIAGSELGSNTGVDSIVIWMIVSICFTVLFIYCYINYFIYDITTIPIIVSLMISIGLFGDSMTGAYPSILIGNIISGVVVIVTGYYFRKFLLKNYN